MSKIPQKRSPEFKLKLALEALKGVRPITEIASENNLHPKQIQRWRDKLLLEAQAAFAEKSNKKKDDPDKKDLLKIIDQLSFELEFIKKKLEKFN